MRRDVACLLCCFLLLGVGYAIAFSVDYPKGVIGGGMFLIGAGYMFRCSIENDPK